MPANHIHSVCCKTRCLHHDLMLLREHSNTILARVAVCVLGQLDDKGPKHTARVQHA